MLPDSGLARVALSFYLSLTSALVEEIMHKGVWREILASYFKDRNFAMVYAVSSSTLLALGHWGSVAEVITIFLEGLVLAMIYIRLRTLWPLIVSHFLIDVVVFY